MTDLFISATAALLLVLAVMQPTPPVPIPIQSDLLVRCPEPDAAEKWPLALYAAANPEAPPLLVDRPADLGLAPARLGLPPRLFYTIALQQPIDSPVSAGCLSFVVRDLVRRYNRSLTESDRDSVHQRAIFSIAVAAPESPGLTQ